MPPADATASAKDEDGTETGNKAKRTMSDTISDDGEQADDVQLEQEPSQSLPPARRDEHPTPGISASPTERVEDAADGMSAFNSVLWEIAKSFGILTLMFLMVFTLFMAWKIAQWGAGLL